MSHVICPKCEGAEARCTSCGKPWQRSLDGKHRCGFGQRRATHKKHYQGCDGRHRDFKCDRCGLVAEGRPPQIHGHGPQQPEGWVRATAPGQSWANLDLCGSCAPRHAVAFDSAMGNEDASKLDEAINRVESIACGWAFDYGVRVAVVSGLRDAEISFTGDLDFLDFPLPHDFRRSVLRVLDPLPATVVITTNTTTGVP